MEFESEDEVRNILLKTMSTNKRIRLANPVVVIVTTGERLQGNDSKTHFDISKKEDIDETINSLLLKTGKLIKGSVVLVKGLQVIKHKSQNFYIAKFLFEITYF